MKKKLAYIVFKDNYFEGKVICDNLIEVKKIIHENPNNHIRVQINDFRVLLHPVNNKNQRVIDGFSDLYLLYKYFNNITEDKLSQIIRETDHRKNICVYIDYYK